VRSGRSGSESRASTTKGTRYLNRFELAVHGRRLQLLRSTVRSDHVLAVDLTNPDSLDLHEPVASFAREPRTGSVRGGGDPRVTSSSVNHDTTRSVPP
jgi:glycogen debranching enzyme-like protein